jgi:hypothetical protein
MLQLRCIVCHEPFDFDRHETAIVLRHIAYGHDFVHSRHEATALDWIFVDPEYDRPAFTHDARRTRILDVASPDGWTAVLPESPERIAAGCSVRFEPLRLWTLVEYRDGSRHVEGLIRDAEWETEPGGANFPEGEWAAQDAVGYAPTSEKEHPTRIAEWEAILHARNRSELVAPSRAVPSVELQLETAPQQAA